MRENSPADREGRAACWKWGVCVENTARMFTAKEEVKLHTFHSFCLRCKPEHTPLAIDCSSAMLRVASLL